MLHNPSSVKLQRQKLLQMRLVCYSVLEIVPAHVWQNADCHLQSPIYQALHKTIKPFCLPLRGCYAMLDSWTPSSANSAARQALVLFFFCLCLLENVMKIQLTISQEQLEILAQSLNFCYMNDKLLSKRDPTWVDLNAIIRLANNEVNDNIPRIASYKVIR